MIRMLLVVAIVFGILYFFPVQQLITDGEDRVTIGEATEDAQERFSSIDFESVALQVVNTVDDMADRLMNLDQEATPTFNPSQMENQETTNDIDTADFEIQELEEEVHKLVNEKRAEHDLNRLEFSEEASVVAREKSRDMAVNNYFAHESPTYGSPFDMMDEFGLTYRQAGENLAKGQRTAEEVMEGWMNSEGHRENILHEDFTHIGVGYVKDGGQTYWTQMFVGK
ncbi:CAP domain-containing protein [Alkalibacillus almallahensis]|uniref:CAP domain-containing protein n=1 Tax=Alkalibacillus almallahensis TaxID=1379154 RepID=UPI00141F52AD|nr:CAP domain-containing protein [Alkalibacillus almallahensis]NIK11621.1 putative YkwD family protein [Alkalibacillus almallahensis]